MARKARDSQRAKVYAWEREWIGMGAPVPDAKGWIAKAIGIVLGARAKVPKIRIGAGWDLARAGSDRMNLPRWAWSTMFLCHELGHTVEKRMEYECSLGGKCQGHGPEYVRVYIMILAILGGMDSGTLVESAKLSGVKIATMAGMDRTFKGSRIWRRIKRVHKASTKGGD